MHCSGNYFSTKQVSDKDVEVEGGTQDEAYLGKSTLANTVVGVLPNKGHPLFLPYPNLFLTLISIGEYLTGILQAWLPYLTKTIQPDLVFYQAGVDVHKDDRLGKLKLSRAGVSKRNHMVYAAVKR